MSENGNAENRVDACGLSCPEPVLLTQGALKEYGAAAFSVDVSSPAARDNVKRFLEERGRAVQVEPLGQTGWRVKAGEA
ncbi:MAG: sulfurtransferase TusA family protein [Treponema sp.]|jgi:TusA-related sulfurtransferase|nr:sulfurtransferase TusA family protein [Treponema sp.]